MTRKPHPDREALFPAKTEPPLDSSEEVTTEPPVEDETVQIPIFPTAAQLTKVSGEWAIVRMTDIKCSAMFSLDRAQCIELGSALLKCANSMPSPKALLHSEKRLIVARESRRGSR
jgi:hypothetical protein